MYDSIYDSINNLNVRDRVRLLKKLAEDLDTTEPLFYCNECKRPEDWCDKIYHCELCMNTVCENCIENGKKSIDHCIECENAYCDKCSRTALEYDDYRGHKCAECKCIKNS